MAPAISRHVMNRVGVLAALFTLAACDVGPNEVKQTAKVAAPIIRSHQTTGDHIGMQVEDFQLVDHLGTSHQLYGFKHTPAIVLMTQGNGCPIVRNAVPALRNIRDAYVDRGIEFFLLNSNVQDNQATIAAEADRFGFDMRVLIDESQQVGESLKVTRTAEIFVIDPISRKVVYHGPVDDRLNYQSQRAEAKHNYLKDALDAVLEGQEVLIAQVDAPGCLVNFPNRELL